jgi:adenosine deaminase/aminodeoxyfutalosine deaminase
MAPFLRDLPKAELHVHLEGSVEIETWLALDPSLAAPEIREAHRYEGFAGFLRCFKWCVERLRSPEDYGFIASRLLDRLAEQNVRYAEITLSAGAVLRRGQDLGAVYDAVRGVAKRAAVETHWILDAIRHFGPEPAMEVARFAASRVGDGVIAFGIGGDEERGPAEWFLETYKFARAAGLRLNAHAGETMGPESVWAALSIGAERIGHGIRSIEDPALLRELRDRDIPLEVCVTSNVQTGAVASLEAHPVRRLYDAGVPIVLNTDDPGVFGVTLTGEFELAARQFGFSEAELRGIAANGFRYAFAAR